MKTLGQKFFLPEIGKMTLPSRWNLGERRDGMDCGAEAAGG
jgi:hypothetical protein